MSDSDPTLAYVQYMKFARRAEGIKSARTVIFELGLKKFSHIPEYVLCYIDYLSHLNVGFEELLTYSGVRVVLYRLLVASQRTSHIFRSTCCAISTTCRISTVSGDFNIAFRIFELGLKNFSHIPEYVLCYIDYLSHLNVSGDFNIAFRIFELGLKKFSHIPDLAPESSVDIWNRFLEFESNIGDLVSIVKVEKRRQAQLEKIKEFEGKETAQLVDRYKFLDLHRAAGLQPDDPLQAETEPATGRTPHLR
ncbi:Protein suppressor of forked [Operophtera brumata]|uniref:Protein suppressor of forked n=1 Tax=Operophtera brumata TaxID=104452 RepID=A0A0L7LNJ6_OPEBR|nr:Protein suppressor of forked [Operophtera brumata]